MREAASECGHDGVWVKANDLSAPLRNLWYVPALSSSLKSGKMRREMLLGEPIVLGRDHDGKTFALRDICPHRGVPLSAGVITTDGAIECPYHGWRFRADGVCAGIPSLAPGQAFDPGRITVRNYPTIEQDGLIWVYMACKGQEARAPASGPPKVQIEHARPRWTHKQTFSCAIDHAVIGLMDPVHAAFVHRHWWWRRTIRLKKKQYLPLPAGFIMARHKPTKPAYGLLGNVTTEITFELPAARFETIEGTLLGRPFRLISLTLCTPRDADCTDIFQIFYWPGWLFFIRPFFTLLGRTFIDDDRKIIELQKDGLRFDPTLMLIPDADMPAIWYHRIKKAWIEASESGTSFDNPMQERVVWWRS